jgi:hypothetical protein
MQVRAADGTTRRLYNSVAAMFDDRVRNGFISNVFLALPDKRFNNVSRIVMLPGELLARVLAHRADPAHMATEYEKRLSGVELGREASIY